MNIQIIEDITIEMVARRDELYGFSPKFIPGVFLIQMSVKWPKWRKIKSLVKNHANFIIPFKTLVGNHQFSVSMQYISRKF